MGRTRGEFIAKFCADWGKGARDEANKKVKKDFFCFAGVSVENGDAGADGRVSFLSGFAVGANLT
jgi:hypothetical protein